MSVLPQGKYAQCANGHRMHYLDVGEGPVVVFLHGSGPGASGHSNFKGNYPYLVERGYRCIVPDHIGMGLSDKPDDGRYRYTLDSRVADFSAFMEKMLPSGPVTQWADRERWKKLMLASLAMAEDRFTSHRMVNAYFDRLYAEAPVAVR